VAVEVAVFRSVILVTVSVSALAQAQEVVSITPRRALAVGDSTVDVAFVAQGDAAQVLISASGTSEFGSTHRHSRDLDWSADQFICHRE
jgi:hypothetical protein